MIEYDLPVGDVDERLRDVATSVVPKWWGTLEYCELFPSMFPAERIYIRIDDKREASSAYCYREQIWRFGKLINVLGPLHSSLSVIYQLMMDREANVSIINYVREDDLTAYRLEGFRYILISQGSDLVIHLPSTFEEYIEQIGASTRKNLQYYFRRLLREFPDADVRAFWGNGISPFMIEQIIDFNAERKYVRTGKRISRPPFFKDLAFRMAKQKGICVLLMHGQEILAGTLSYLHRSDAYFILIGHNINYDNLNLGKVILARTIEEYINISVRRFYLHYGHSLYKLLLGGQEEPMFKVLVFRDMRAYGLWKLSATLQSMMALTRKTVRSLAHRITKPEEV